MKRQRNLFNSDEDAVYFVESYREKLPQKDIWIKILSIHPELSIDDILRMCRTDKYFNELCKSGRIWEEIFKRQFGSGNEYEYVKSFGPVFKYEFLLAYRAFKSGDMKEWLPLYGPKGSYRITYDSKDRSFKIDAKPYFVSDEIQIEMISVVKNLAKKNNRETMFNPFNSNILYILAGDLNSQDVGFRLFLFLTLKGYLFSGEDRYIQFTGCKLCAVSKVKYKCGKCQLAAYCSENCAKIDWNSKHSFDCN